jgi:hypothetical protein
MVDVAILHYSVTRAREIDVQTPAIDPQREALKLLIHPEVPFHGR